MAITVTAADYSGTVETFRNHLRYGTVPSGAEMRTAIGVIQDAVTRLGTSSTDLTALRTGLDAQFVILQAGGAGDISAEVDTADTTLDALLDAVEADVTAWGTPTYTVNVNADG